MTSKNKRAENLLHRAIITLNESKHNKDINLDILGDCYTLSRDTLKLTVFESLQVAKIINMAYTMQKNNNKNKGVI